MRSAASPRRRRPARIVPTASEGSDEADGPRSDGASRSTATQRQAPSRTTSSTSLSEGTWISRSSSARIGVRAGAGTTGLLLRYVGEDVALRRPDNGGAEARRHAPVGATKAGSSFEPILLREAGSLAFDSLMGEYLTYSNAALQVKPALATAGSQTPKRRSGRSSSAGVSSSTTARLSTPTMSSRASSSTWRRRPQSSSPLSPRPSSHPRA